VQPVGRASAFVAFSGFQTLKRLAADGVSEAVAERRSQGQPLRSLRLTRALTLYGVNSAAPIPTTSSDNRSPSTWITTK
jgi:hypothetical protein